MDVPAPETLPVIEPPARFPERLALRIIQAGAIATVLAVATLPVFELDRFFVPKELVLHVVAVLAGLLAFRATARTSREKIDTPLAGFLLLSAVSAVFATNPWVAFRALAVSASGAVLFWTARALRERGLARPLLNALALAVIAASVMSLLQTYGVETLLFSENRSPGGTLGNRNFVAHAAAFGFPLVLLAAFRAGGRAFLFWSAGATAAVASLVLTRSRAAWLAFAAVMLVVLAAMMISGPLRREGRIWKRMSAIAVLAGLGVAAAMLLPNTLHWRSDDPYLQTVRRIADYQEGSGRGRLIQYRRSLLIAVRHPILGVGPGNWAVVYPAHAPANDPSLDDSEPGMTSNPWPSSDWVAMVTERGPLAAALMALVFLGIAGSGLRQLLRAENSDDAIAGVALLGTVTGAAVTGMFDAVLLLGMPAFLVWCAFGALRTSPVPAEPASRDTARRLVLLVAIAIAAAGATRSGAQLVAMNIQTARGDRNSLVLASRIDPGSYRLHLRLARLGRGSQRCEHARAAHALYPGARAAAQAARGCR